MPRGKAAQRDNARHSTRSKSTSTSIPGFNPGGGSVTSTLTITVCDPERTTFETNRTRPLSRTRLSPLRWSSAAGSPG